MHRRCHQREHPGTRNYPRNYGLAGAGDAFALHFLQSCLGAAAAVLAPIVAHEAIVIELSRAFFRAVEPEAERNNASRAQQEVAARV